ncbi:MAG TPA: PD-(D/E)XK nuclease family protein [Phycisphaerae bacterium]|nr:PD-(D/E)XK nuclease family protein [Phycisphaerae bacterium]
MNGTVQTLTHSRCACFRACPRKHYLRYELGLQPEESSLALRIGSAHHAALEAVDKGQDPAAAIEAAVSDPYDLALVAAMHEAHRRRYTDAQLEVVATEMEFNLSLRNPKTGAPTPVWRFCGKIDRIVRLPDGRVALMEYKTTSQDFAPGANYWLKLHLDQQLSLYVIAARQMGYPVETVLYDVTRRPALRPLKATPEESRKYTKDGRLYANQRDQDETPEEFAGRVAADIAERPDHYFARIEIARLDQDLDDCAAELWQQQLAIREAQRTRRWYRNPSACFGPNGNGGCEYLPICLVRDLETATPPGFSRLSDAHPELTGTTTSEG